jgi:hypothetical protein
MGEPIEVSAVSAVDAVRIRRAELREALGELEQALAAPAAARALAWGHTLHAAVGRLVTEFALHVEVTEGAGGLHQTILAGDLRLTNQVAALVAEHKTIAADIAELAAACEAPVAQDDVAATRERGTTVLGRIIRHRQRGADLVYEAYATDIGGGD